MKWIKLPESFHRMSKRAIAAAAISVIVPTSTVITLAATGTLNHSSVSASSTVNSTISTAPSMSALVSSIVSSSDTVSSSAVSSSKGSDRVADDIDAINQATAAGLDKISSATNKAIDDINSAKQTNSSSSQTSSSTSSTSPVPTNNHHYDIPDPNDQHKNIDVEDSNYQTAVDTYNAYAKSKGAAQDAGAWTKEKYYCYKSEAILLWAKDHGWVIGK